MVSAGVLGGISHLHGIPLFLIQVLLMVGMSRLVALVCKRLKQPTVVAEIIAGIILGPSVLGNIPTWTSTLFAPQSLEPLHMMSSLALIFYMFVVGIQLDLEHVKKTGMKAVVVSTTGLLTGLVFAVPVAYMCDSLDYHATSFNVFVLFLGVLFGISALPVMARILAERGMLTTPFGMFVMACKIVNDVEIWPILALATTLATSGDALNVLWAAPVVVGDILILLLVIKPILVRATSRLPPGEVPHWYMFLVSFTLIAFACATEFFGLTSILGALQVGMVMPRSNNNALSLLASKIQDLTVVVLLPLFFAVSGLKTDLFLLADYVTWIKTFVLLAAAYGTMLLGASVPALAMGILPRDAATLGLLMTTKGLVGLVALNAGYDADIISAKFFSMCTVMILGTTITVVPLMTLIQPKVIPKIDHPAVGGPRPALLGRSHKTVVVFLEHYYSSMTMLTATKLFCKSADLLAGLRFHAVSDRPSDFMGTGDTDSAPVTVQEHAHLLGLPMLNSRVIRGPDAYREGADYVERTSPALVVLPFNQYDEGDILPTLLQQQSQVGVIAAVMSHRLPVAQQSALLVVSSTSDATTVCEWLKTSRVTVHVLGMDDTPATNAHVDRLVQGHLATRVQVPEDAPDRIQLALTKAEEFGLLLVTAEPQDASPYSRSRPITHLLRKCTVSVILIFRALRYAPSHLPDSAGGDAEELESQYDPPGTVITMAAEPAEQV